MGAFKIGVYDSVNNCFFGEDNSHGELAGCWIVVCFTAVLSVPRVSAAAGTGA